MCKKFSVLAFFLCLSYLATSQSYRYYSIVMDDAENLAIDELDYYMNATKVTDVPLTKNYDNGESIWGTSADIKVYYQMVDDDQNTNAYLGEGTITAPLKIVYDFGVSTAANKLQIHKKVWSKINHLQCFGSNNKLQWDLLLDQTYSNPNWTSQTLTLQKLVDNVRPSTPQNLSATYVRSDRVTLQWEASTDDVGVQGYIVYKDNQQVATVYSTHHMVSGLQPNTAYKFHVVALDTKNGSVSSPAIDILTCYEPADSELPSKVTGVIAQTTAKTIDLTWNAATDNIAMNGYLVYLNNKLVGTTTDTTIVIPNLDPSTNYDVRIISKDRNGNEGVASTTVSVQTLALIGEKMDVGTNFIEVDWVGAGGSMFTEPDDNVTKDNPWVSKLYEEVSIYKTFRFMPMLRIHASGGHLTKWTNRPKQKDPSQKLLAYEWIIDYCNRNNANLWMNIPHEAVSRSGAEKGTNSFMKKLAILIKTGIDMGDVDMDAAHFSNMSKFTNLDYIHYGGVKVCEPLKDELKVLIEYSNETWNGIFPCFHYAMREGHALQLDPAYSGPAETNWKAGFRFHSWAAIRMFEEFEAVFGEDVPRLDKVSGMFGSVGEYSVDAHHFEVYDNSTFNPNGTMPNSIAIAPYIGYDSQGILFDGADPHVFDSLKYGVHGITWWQEILKATRFKIDSFAAKKNIPLRYIAYEGGQHIKLDAQLASFNYKTYDVYNMMLDSFNLYMDEFVHFVHVAEPNNFGAWGAKEFIGQSIYDAHKYHSLSDWSGTAAFIDSLPPSQVTGLQVVKTSPSSVTLSWNYASDDGIVKGYQVFVGDYLVGFTSENTYEVGDLGGDLSYDFSVRALDNYHHLGVLSTVVSGTTDMQEYSIMIKVIDKFSQAIVGAEVKINNQTILTNTQGEVTVHHLNPGTYPVEVSMNGLGASSFDVNIDCDADVVYSKTVQLFSTSIGEYSDYPFQVYPNPIGQSTTMHINNIGEDHVYFELYNMIGERVMVESLQKESAKELLIGVLSKGVYVYKVVGSQENNLVNMGRIIVQ